MKTKLYTKSHNTDLLKEIDNAGGQFNAQEHAYVMEREFSDKFKTRESLLYWYLSRASKQLSALGFLIRYVHDNNFTNILSLGAGACVLEHLLRYALPENGRVIAADFDAYLISKANMHFRNIIAVTYDFFNEDVGKFLDIIPGWGIDIAVFFGSAYTMDDAIFINVFKRLKEIGVKQIIDFQGGYIDLQNIINTFFIFPLKESYILRKLFGKPPLRNDYRGKFHGYGRTRGELKKLYRKAGLNLVKEIRVLPYKYVAILNCQGE